LAGLGLRAVTGDMGILLAAIESLSTTDARKDALRRHVWRPRRFRALLDRYTGACPPSPDAGVLLDQVGAEGLDAVIDAAGVETGLRTRADIASRIETLRADAETPPSPGRRRMCWARSCRSRPICPTPANGCAT
jgi:ATP phosphoribosyltransferase regulatory subunit